MTAVLPSRKAQSERKPANERKASRRLLSLSPLSLFEALATPHRVDRYLELVNPMLTVRDLRAEVVGVHRSTLDSVTLTLRPTRQWKGFRAGQFVQVTVEIDGVRRTRCYSPSCSQYRADGLIEITIKAHPQGLVSQYLHANARRGLVVGLCQADGIFHLPELRPDRLLFISGGSGITPVLSMLRTLCDEGYRGEVVFLHYSNGAHDVALREELVELASAHANVRLVLAYTDASDGDLTGFFGQQHLDAVAPWAVQDGDAQTYLCGPPALMSSVKSHFAKAGRTDSLHVEEFQPSLVVADDGEPTGTTSFGDVAAANDGTTLLEQAESAGLSPEHGCRMGICFSCTQIKTSGCTRNIRTGELDSDPDTEIQLCINVPVGDVAINL
jgi:ferredoxin-NADP reductase